MNTTPINTADTAVLDAGTYEIIQQRLQTQTTELRGRLAQLNEMRKTVFGAIETQLVANERIHTQNHCIARDMVAIGNWCVLGYNVHIGLRSGIQLSDVFSSFELEEHSFRAVPLKWEQHEKFVQDFQNLYRYYKNAFFARFVRQEAYLYLVFQISANVSDIKVFKWLVKGDELHYIDNRSEHEIRQIRQHEFDWKRAKRDDQRKGKHPHISILDRVFVETVGGDLTIKVEDNTDDGLGIYRETVEQADQTLDDATFRYADLDNLIALNIRPYQEKDRYFIFNEKIQRVQRIDALADSGILLPDGHGLIFANGYYLQDGEYKIFPTELRNLQFEKRISSPNGEDYLYIFLQQHTGIYVLLSYNVIARQIATPIICHGYTIFSNGLLCYFRAEDEPSKHHLIQIWQTPYLKDSSFPSEHTDNYLYKIGNKDIVKAMAETNSIISLAQKEDVYTDLYEDLVRMTTHLLDSYYWLNRPEAMELHAPIENIRTTAAAAITEYEKKIGIERATNETLRTVQTRATALFDTIRRTTFDLIDQYVTQLADLRSLRGELISAKSLRYADTTSIEQLETTTAAEIAQLSERAVQFLLEEDALLPYQHKITEQREALQTAQIAVVVNELLENITNIGTELEMLIEIVSNLKIEDATQTTRIIDHISVCYAQLNQLKAQARRRRQELKGTESVATFNAQLKLLEQAIVNYLDISDTPTRCDEYLTKLMIQLDELESKFVEFDDFVEKLTDKRTTIYDAFETRKKRLIASFNSRTTALQQSAERILKGIQTRAQHYQELDEINAFFAADLMVDKVRNIIAQLTELKDTNKANAIQTQLKTVQEETIR
ncbi:MAG: DNA repair ATPase, partial [Bacteroidota bacterium]